MRKRTAISLLLAPLLCYAGNLTPPQEEVVTNIVCKFFEESAEELLAQTETLMPEIMSLMQISPFELLQFVIGDRELRMKLINGLENPTKNRLFVQGFSLRMMQEVFKPEFGDNLEAFCSLFQLDKEVMQTFASQGNWSQFILHPLEEGKSS